MIISPSCLEINVKCSSTTPPIGHQSKIPSSDYPMHMRHGQIQLSLLPSFRFDRRWRVRKLPTFNQCYLLYFYVNSPRPDA